MDVLEIKRRLLDLNAVQSVEFTTGSSLMKVAALPGLNDKVVGAVTVWDRSDPATDVSLPFSHSSIIKEHIPLWTED